MRTAMTMATGEEKAIALKRGPTFAPGTNSHTANRA
jgi:hypothetical protein